MTNLDRLQKEQAFHDQRFGGDDNERASARKYYAANKHLNERYPEIVSQLCKGKTLLEYGCGVGSGSKQWLKMGAKVVGIDISPEAIKKAKEQIENSEYDADYFVMDAENTEFDDGTFDIIVGTGILHHLDLKMAYQELSRILKPDGHIVFSEPLGHNPIINLYRRLTPKMRTEDEHPLRQQDLNLIKMYFNDVKIEYFSLLTLLSVPLRNSPIYTAVYEFLKWLDQLIFLLPFVKRWAWMVIIHASNPRM